MNNRIFKEIDNLLLQKKTVLMAIDGDSASGKTTLAKKLSEKYDCNVFHVDDFFLSPSAKTNNKISFTNENINYESILNEIILPIISGKSFLYEPYDCRKDKFCTPVIVTPKKLNIVEGSYSMHPYLARYYDYTVFLHIDGNLQRERILNRNTADMQKRFFEEWIPKEKEYFTAYFIPQCCNAEFNAEDLICKKRSNELCQQQY